MSNRLFIHRNGNRVLVGTGFNWWSFFFGTLYALVTAQWFLFIACLGLNVLVFFLSLGGCPPLLLFLMFWGTSTVMGFQCNGWYAETLLERGYEERSS